VPQHDHNKRPNLLLLFSVAIIILLIFAWAYRGFLVRGKEKRGRPEKDVAVGIAVTWQENTCVPKGSHSYTNV
jgi:hypothetical protein